MRLVACALLAVCVRSTAAHAHALGDLVFCDLNGNGIFEPTQDFGIGGVTVVRDCGGTLTTTVTNAAGRYVFLHTPAATCRVYVDSTSPPISGLAVSAPRVAGPPPPTAEHSPFPGFGCGSCPSAFVTTVVADGVFQTTVNNPCNCTDPACPPTGTDPCFGPAPFIGYYGDDFGFVCTTSTTTTTTTTSSTSTSSTTTSSTTTSTTSSTTSSTTTSSTTTSSTTSSTTTTSTTTSTTTTVPLDHFQCYQVDHAPKSIPVTLDGEFGPSTATLVAVRRLCNPADKNGEDPLAPTHPGHLVAYGLRQTSARFTPTLGEPVTNQFGTFVVSLTRPLRLLVPSSKSLTAPPPALDPAVAALDHYECYKLTGGGSSFGPVTIRDEFGTGEERLLKAEQLCVPVDKDGGGIFNPVAKLMCYGTRRSPGASKLHGPGSPVFVNNQFGADTFLASRMEELCVPSSPGGAFLEAGTN